ncbi:site-specific integrase [Stenotrophomonas acidaminiphila]|uniref:site-specific integrase n=2 Tax=Lysobacteraceae TaxID=32033 RepID=UPI0028AEA1C0|nr:site-specific integrase [Stenotrophomonas acidaminiphila]
MTALRGRNAAHGLPPRTAGVSKSGSPRLLDRMHVQIRLWHYSAGTGRACVGWGRRFISANGKRRPGALGAKEVEASLTSLATTSNVAAATRNQALSALLFP